MFASHQQQLEEDSFANIKFHKNVECLIPTAEILINFCVNGLRTKKKCLMYAEKMDFKGLIQLRLAEKFEQRCMYITTITTTTFQQLKQDQSLHVTFNGFIENLLRLLQDCLAGKLEINLVQLSDYNAVETNSSNNYSTTVDYQLQFVEMRPFKNLIHLCLPCRIAPLNVVLFYMNNILDAIQKKAAAQELATQQFQQELNSHLRRIEHLDAENYKLREKLTENERMINERHTQEVQKMQESLRKSSEQRLSDNERNRKTITSLQMQIEKLSVEKANFLKEKNQELKRNEILSEEMASMKTHLNTLREQNEKLHSEIATQQNQERKNEMHLNDTRKHIGELQEKLKKYDKAKADIVAELEAEKKISHTKRQALEMAAEEISKANEIILKHSQELIKLKKTVTLRTEVALEQEKAINEKDIMLNLRNDELMQMRLTNEHLRHEIPRQLESMRTFADTLEKKYTEQINALKEKLKLFDKENQAPNRFNGCISSRRH